MLPLQHHRLPKWRWDSRPTRWRNSLKRTRLLIKRPALASLQVQDLQHLHLTIGCSACSERRSPRKSPITMEARPRDLYRHYREIQAATSHQDWHMQSSLLTSQILRLPPDFTGRHWATKPKWSRQVISHRSQHWRQVNRNQNSRKRGSQSFKATKGYHHSIQRTLNQILNNEATVWCQSTHSIEEHLTLKDSQPLKLTIRRCKSISQVMRLLHKWEWALPGQAWQCLSRRTQRNLDSQSLRNNDNKDSASIVRRRWGKAIVKVYWLLIEHMNRILTTCWSLDHLK